MSGETEKPPQAATPPQVPHARGLPWLGLREDVPRPVSAAAAVACVSLVLGLWWFATRGAGEERLLSPAQFPSIREVVDYFGPNMWNSEKPELHLLRNTFVSLKRVVLGFLLALAVGIPLGIAAGCFSIVRSFLSPLILFGRNIPIAALTGIVFALFGIDELQKVMFIFIACVAFIISDTMDSVGDVAQRYIETALTLGASRFQIVRKVLVPLAMPSVFNSLRVLFGLAFGYIMLVEVINAGEGARGLGYILLEARKYGRRESVVIIILAIPLVAWMIDQMLFVMQCSLFRWKYAREAERSLAFRAARAVLRLFWRPQTKTVVS